MNRRAEQTGVEQRATDGLVRNSTDTRKLCQHLVQARGEIDLTLLMWITINPWIRSYCAEVAPEQVRHKPLLLFSRINV